MTPMRLTHATALILRAIAAGHRHGFDIMEASGLPSGTVYPALRRLEAWGHVTSAWEDAAAAHVQGRPRRRLYALTSTGLVQAAAAGERLQEARRLLSADGELGGLPEGGEA